jgi:hypothetical protein
LLLWPSPTLLFSPFPAQLSLHTLTFRLNRSSALSVSSPSRTLCMRPSLSTYLHLPSLRKSGLRRAPGATVSSHNLLPTLSSLRSYNLQDKRTIMRTRMETGALNTPPVALLFKRPHPSLQYTNNAGLDTLADWGFLPTL